MCVTYYTQILYYLNTQTNLFSNLLVQTFILKVYFNENFTNQSFCTKKTIIGTIEYK